MAHVHRHRAALLARVKRIAGQVAAIERAIEEDTDCSGVLHQVAGVRGAVSGLMEALLEDHVREHVAGPGLSQASRKAAADELLALLKRYGK
jgi:FrmR/RcnR family transcriptional regulator, repressor of frmRAB operon